MCNGPIDFVQFNGSIAPVVVAYYPNMIQFSTGVQCQIRAIEQDLSVHCDCCRSALCIPRVHVGQHNALRAEQHLWLDVWSRLFVPKACTELVLTGRSWSVLPWTCKDTPQRALRRVILKSYSPTSDRVTSLGITCGCGLTDRNWCWSTKLWMNVEGGSYCKACILFQILLSAQIYPFNRIPTNLTVMTVQFHGSGSLYPNLTKPEVIW